MYALDKQQVDLIERDVWSARITFSHLADELIDHICCEVENMMWDGKSFEEAYEIMKQQTGIKVLQKIQENTHYLIDKNYRIMKMTMKITGNISLVMLALGTVMKLFHWPGAGVMLVLGFVVLCLVFFPSAIYTNYRDSKLKQSKFLHLSILLGGILFMAGVLFKVQHWPGAAVLLLAGWFFILFVFLPVLLFVKRKESTSRRDRIVIALGVIGLIIFELSTMFKLFHWPGAGILMIVGSILLVSVFLPLFTYARFKQIGKITGEYIFLITGSMFFILFTVLLAINVSKDIQSVNVNSFQKNAAIISYLDQKNLNLFEVISNNPDTLISKHLLVIKPIHEESNRICNQIESIKTSLIMATDDVDKQTAERYLQSVSMVKNISNIDLVNKTLIGENCNGFAYSLKKDLQNFQSIISTSGLPADASKPISILTNTPEIDINGTTTPWEIYTFEHNTVINCLVVLSDIEKKVRLAELQAVSSIIKTNF
jgi:hypothetical protein